MVSSSALQSDADGSSPMQPVSKQEETITPTVDGYIKGWRLFWLSVGLYFGSFLAQLEMTVVSTALVSITDDLHDFANSTWIVNSYLLVWSGFLIIWAQFSHSIGRKPCTAAALIIFIVFSAGCAAAQTSTQLIVLRAFQGLGGAGVYNLALTTFAEAVPPTKFPKYVALMSIVAALAFALGPLIGGAIATHSTWRWVFILNVPAGVLTLAIDMLAIPNGFPNHHKSESERPKRSIASLRALDPVGALLFLCTSILFVTVLQEAGVFYAWRSAFTIVLLIISGIALLLFTLWERLLYLRKSQIVPLISWELAYRRSIGLCATSFLVGIPYTSSLVQIPQRLQVINGFSAFEAGVRLIAFVVMIPVGAAFGSVLLGKFKIRPCFGLLIGGVLQLIAVVCFATIPDYPSQQIVSSASYAFQILFGFGSGINNAVTTNAVPLIVKFNKKLIAPSIGANTQFRFLGGAVGLGIVTAVLNGFLRPRLAEIVPEDVMGAILESTDVVAALSPDLQARILTVFADGFVLQWKVLCGFVGAQILASLLTL